MEIVRLHAPELDETLARRLVEVVDMVRALDLKKPPSIAESIDWARTLLLMGADDIDAEIFEQSISILVKHRTDIDLVAERVGVKLGETLKKWRSSELGASVNGSPYGAKLDAGPPGLAAKLLAFCEELRSEGVAVGTSEILDAFAALDQVPWTVAGGLPRGAGGDDRQVPGGPARLRAALRPLLLPRRRGRGGAARPRRAGEGRALRGGERTRHRRAARRGPRRRSSRATTARCATSRGSRSPPSGAGRGLGRGRRRRAADPPHARASPRAPSRRPRTARSCRRSTASS